MPIVDPRTISPVTGAPILVESSSGATAPFAADHLLGSLVRGGLEPAAAIPAADTISTVVGASGQPVVTTDQLRSAVGELVTNPTNPDLARLSATFTSGLPPSAQLSEEGQDQYVLEVLNLVHVATEIRSGRADILASRIEDYLVQHLREMMTFVETPYRALAFNATGLLYDLAKKPIPSDLQVSVAAAQQAAAPNLSDGCFATTICNGDADCHRWPTSLPDIDTGKEDPMGWHYIIGSHCGFHWPRFWKLDCGNPKGLTACTG